MCVAGSADVIELLAKAAAELLALANAELLMQAAVELLAQAPPLASSSAPRCLHKLQQLRRREALALEVS